MMRQRLTRDVVGCLTQRDGRTVIVNVMICKLTRIPLKGRDKKNINER